MHHEYSRAHRAVTTNDFLAKDNIPLLQHPPYSPELSPYFFLFPELKKTMKYR
jgi:histone-lysine N-methyltransferase SETMAR